MAAIFSCSEDITPTGDIFSLFHAYQEYYPKKEAIQYFLQYFQIWDYFVKAPTAHEVLTLGGMYRDSSYKMVGALLGMNSRTADVHARSLCGKLKANELHAVLVKVRDGHRDQL